MADAAARRGRAQLTPRALRLRVPPNPRGMNRLEQAWALVLQAEQQQGRIQWWAYEPLKLKLARATFYTPDFVVVTAEGELEMHEVKGFWRDDARVKIKVAADLNPWVRFIAIQRKGRQGWSVERIG